MRKEFYVFYHSHQILFFLLTWWFVYNFVLLSWIILKFLRPGGGKSQVGWMNVATTSGSDITVSGLLLRSHGLAKFHLKQRKLTWIIKSYFRHFLWYIRSRAGRMSNWTTSYCMVTYLIPISMVWAKFKQWKFSTELKFLYCKTISNRTMVWPKWTKLIAYEKFFANLRNKGISYSKSKRVV